MSNKSRLQTNNTNLQALIDKANALPDAGGSGGSVETCTVTVTSDKPEDTHIFYTSIDENGLPIASFASPGILTVVCNTAIGVHFIAPSEVYTGSGFADNDPSYWDYYPYAVLLAPREANAQAYLNCIDDG